MYNFNNVEEVGTERAPRKIVSPSVDVFTIEEAEVKENVNKKEYLKVKFVNPQGQYFNPQFYLTEKALIRVKDLAIDAGVVLGDQETNDTLVAKLVGKKVGLIVDGEKVMATIDGRDVAVTQPILRFRGFSFKPGEKVDPNSFKIEDKTANVVPMAAPVQADVDDLPF